MLLKVKFYHISILVSFVGLVLIINQNYQLGIQYVLTDGKTQAFYSLKSTLLNSKFVGFGIVATLLTFVSLFKKEPKKIVLISFVLSVVTTIIPFTNLWKFWL